MRTATPLTAPASSSARAASPPRSATIWLWAATGGASTFVILRGIAAWIAGPDFKSSPKGTDPISDTELFALHCFEGAVFAACASDWVPISHDNSLHTRPDDPRLPADVRAGQGLSGR